MAHRSYCGLRGVRCHIRGIGEEMSTRKAVTPDYVARGSCGDCLKVWSRREEELLAQIRELKEENEKLRLGNGRPER